MSATASAPTMGPTTRGAAPATRIGAPDDPSRIEKLTATARQYLPNVREEAVELSYDAEVAYGAAGETVDDYIDRDKTVAHNIVGAAVTLGLSVIMLILMAIVAGYFVAEAPSDGAFSEAINQVEDVGGTAFILLAVALLAVPVVAIVGYFMRSGLGGFITGGGMAR